MTLIFIGIDYFEPYDIYSGNNNKLTKINMETYSRLQAEHLVT